MVKRISVLGIAAALVVGAGVVVDTVDAPMANAACQATVQMCRGKNINCSNRAEHFNSLKGGVIKWGSIAGRGAWSDQAACWANVTANGMQGA